MNDLCHFDPIDGTLFSRNHIVIAVAGGQVLGLGLVQGQVLQPHQAAVLVWVKGEVIFGRAGEPEPGVFGSLEPELEPDPLEKKPGARAA